MALLAVAEFRMFVGMSLGRLTAVARRALGALAALLALAWPSLAPAKTLYFPHRDAELLQRFQRNGGAALVPESVPAGASLPVVVFLHGTNPASRAHLWFGGGGRDLRPLAEALIESGQVQPFVLAAPSQTKNAGLAATIWQGFDLNRFVDDLARATEGLVTIDRSRVVLAGHSGAGCNPQGGLAGDYWSAGTPLPLALVSIDPCLDRKMGGAFAKRPSEVPLLLWWQSALWEREPQRFEAALAQGKPEGRIDRVRELPPMGANPHEAILPVALASALRELLGATPTG